MFQMFNRCKKKEDWHTLYTVAGEIERYNIYWVIRFIPVCNNKTLQTKNDFERSSVFIYYNCVCFPS